MELLSASLFILAILWVVLVLKGRYAQRLESVLNKWEEDNGVHIVQRSDRWFLRGPFFWTSGYTSYAVCRVSVEDREGNYFNAWLLCGSWLFGPMFSDRVLAVWDD